MRRFILILFVYTLSVGFLKGDDTPVAGSAARRAPDFIAYQDKLDSFADPPPTLETMRGLLTALVGAELRFAHRISKPDSMRIRKMEVRALLTMLDKYSILVPSTSTLGPVPHNDVRLPFGPNGRMVWPEEIPDEELRKNYVEQAEENERQRLKYLANGTLKSRAMLLRLRCVHYIANSYAEPGADLKELRQLLDQQETDEKLRSELLALVKALQ